MSGPLMTFVLALFGPNSWLDGLANLTSARDEDRNTLDTLNADQPALLSALCDAVPFRHFTSSSLGDTYSHESCEISMLRLMMTYSDHMSRWSRNTTAESRLNVAMFLANQTALTSHTAGILPWMGDTGRDTYTAPGIRVSKPDFLPSLIVLSIIVGLQVLGLLWLGCWIVMRPTWTRTLDAMAITRVAASLILVSCRHSELSGKKTGKSWRVSMGLLACGYEKQRFSSNMELQRIDAWMRMRMRRSR